MIRVLLVLVISFEACFSAFAQRARPPFPRPPDPNRNTDSLPYKLNPGLPVFNLLLRDSIELFNTFYIPKGRPIALMFFSPDCEHCQHAMTALTNGMDSISNIRFYLITMVRSMTDIRKFCNDRHLEKYKNIEVVGQDSEFAFIDFFGTMHIPDIALYDSDKQFVHLFEGNINVKDLYQYTHDKKE